MNKCRLALLLFVALWPVAAPAQLRVLHSGGFAAPYRELVPAFEKSAGLIVTSTMGASQGPGPGTIPALLRNGVTADVVIMSKEGLNELAAAGRIVPGTAVDLAQSPLGVAVRTGAPKPDITSIEGFQQTVLHAKSINLVSTPALYMNEKLFPSLGIADEVARKTNGASMADLANTQVDLVLRPVSELVNLPGFDYVGPIPDRIQFVSTFTAAVVSDSRQIDAAKRLIAFLSSEEARAAVRKHGLEPLGGRLSDRRQPNGSMQPTAPRAAADAERLGIASSPARDSSPSACVPQHRARPERGGHSVRARSPGRSPPALA